MSLPAKLALAPVLLAQGVLARRRMPRLPEPDGERHGRIGRGPALRLLVAGDSSAAGVGVAHQRDALVMPLAATLAQACGARVHWHLVARTGWTTAEAAAHLKQVPLERVRADLAVLVSGVNDVTGLVPAGRAVAQRAALVDWLQRSAGVRHTVWVPLPPVHAFPGLPQPLRWVLGTDARRHNAALARWARSRDDVSVAALSLTLDPALMADDGFHPGAGAYRAIAEGVAAHVAAAVWPQLQRELTR